MDLDIVIVIEFLQFLAIAGTMMFLAIQVRRQSRDFREQGELRGYRVYNSLVQQYLDVLNRADENPELNAVWDVMDADRMEELRQAQDRESWGAWHTMTDLERRCYRMVRAAIEVFEQAYVVHTHFDGPVWLDEEAWNKWRQWMAIWSRSPFMEFVWPDIRPRMLSGFTGFFEHEVDLAAPMSAGHAPDPSSRLLPKPRRPEPGTSVHAGD